jgi:hypothetical protein
VKRGRPSAAKRTTALPWQVSRGLTKRQGMDCLADLPFQRRGVKECSSDALVVSGICRRSFSQQTPFTSFHLFIPKPQPANGPLSLNSESCRLWRFLIFCRVSCGAYTCISYPAEYFVQT